MNQTVTGVTIYVLGMSIVIGFQAKEARVPFLQNSRKKKGALIAS